MIEPMNKHIARIRRCSSMTELEEVVQEVLPSLTGVSHGYGRPFCHIGSEALEKSVRLSGNSSRMVAVLCRTCRYRMLRFRPGMVPIDRPHYGCYGLAYTPRKGRNE